LHDRLVASNGMEWQEQQSLSLHPRLRERSCRPLEGAKTNEEGMQMRAMIYDCVAATTCGVVHFCSHSS